METDEVTTRLKFLERGKEKIKKTARLLWESVRIHWESPSYFIYSQYFTNRIVSLGESAHYAAYGYSEGYHRGAH